MARLRAAAKRTVRCYFCGYELVVSARAMSTTCPGCHKAIKIEDLVVKSYVPVVDLQTCGRIRITKRGRVAAKLIQSGDGIICDGSMEGVVETDGDVMMGPKAFWKGKTLQSRSLEIAAGAKLVGVVTVPWHRPQPIKNKKETTARTVTATSVAPKKVAVKKVAAKKIAAKKIAAKKTATKKTATKKVSAKKTAAKKKKKK